MYINFHKYNYELEKESVRAAFEERDKLAYKEILHKWLESNLDEFVARKWEIEEIYYLEKISDFIKLLREAENLYELGFYTGCIALIGVSSEDFARYYSIEKGKPNYEHLSQFERLKKLKNDGLIADSVYSNLDNIRKVRNDCLHYNQSFKQKPELDLKADALTVLNSLKSALKELVGTKPTADVNEFLAITKELAMSKDVRNFDELLLKQRNAFSHLFNFSQAQHPDIKHQVEWGAFEVLAVDDDEIDLKSIFSGFIVCVDLDENSRENISELQILKGDVIFAQVESAIDNLGQSGIWHLVNIHKI